MSSTTLAIDPTKSTTFSAVFKHISPPTAVGHCLFCNLIDPKRKNLVITRDYFIDLYSVKENGSGESHLHWLTTTCVYDDIVDIASVRFHGDKLDSLLVSFSEAKLSVLGFDAVHYELKTLSLHNYEFENLKAGRIQFTRLPILRVDPLQRCAVMLVYDRHLAVLPFRRSETYVAGDKYLSKPIDSTKSSLSWDRRASAPLLSTFTTCLGSSTGEKINNVLDMQFLHGYYEPTLLVLYEPIGTWAGRVSARRDTCCIVALSLNLQKRTNPVIWFQESLPFDCSQICSVPQPIGGILILATNSIIYMKQTRPSYGLPLNCYAQVTTNFPMRQDVPSCGPLTLDGCHVVPTSDSQFLLASRIGKLYLLSLWVERATQTVTSLLLHEIGHTTIPSCLALSDPYLFVGSYRCDSVLLKSESSTILVNTLGETVNSFAEHHVTPIEARNDQPSTVHSEKLDTAVASAVEQPTVNNVDPCETPNANESCEVAHAIDEIDVELYGECISNPSSETHRELLTYSFKPLDRIRNFGPMGTLTAGEVPCLAPGNTDPSDETLTAAQADMQHVELIACVPRSGDNKLVDKDDPRTSGILLLHTSVRPRGLTAFELPEYVSLWSLYGPPVASSNTSGETKKLNEDASDEKESDACKPVEEITKETELEDVESNECEQPDEPAPKKSRDDPEATNLPDDRIADETEGAALPDEHTYSTAPESPQVDTSSSVTEPVHSYLLLTREDSTMILEVGHEIVELEASGFNTTEMTVTAVNLGRDYITQRQVSTLSESPGGPSNSDMPSKPLQVGYDYPYILQVSPTSLRLLDGPKLIEFIQVSREWRIHLASCADPYVLLCTEDDELFLLRLRPPPAPESSPTGTRYPHKKPSFLDLHAARELLSPEKNSQSSCTTPFTHTTHFEFFRPKVGQVSAPLSFCLYHDRAGELARWLWLHHTSPPTDGAATQHNVDHTPGTNESPYQKNIFFPTADAAAFSQMNDLPKQAFSNVDEEDLLIYGQIIDRCKQETLMGPPLFVREPCDMQSEEDTPLINEDLSDKSKYFAFILFTNGVLEIYSLPEFSLLYEVHQFNDLPAMLVDHRGTPTAANTGSSLDEESMPSPILEISVIPVGRNLDRPVLLARTNQEVALFEAICPSPTDVHPYNLNDCRLRWRRLPIPCPLVAPKRIRTDPKIADVQSALYNRATMLRPFDDIGGHRGLFVCGATPIWLFGTDSGQIRVFNHSIDGIMGSFAPLNTKICPSGFVYFTYSNEMRLATLPPGYSYKENLGTRWVPLEVTPCFVQYHIESKTYAVIGTRSSNSASIYHLNLEGNKEEEHLLRPLTCVLPTLDYYSLQMFAPSVFAADDEPWKPIPNTLIQFDDWEAVTSMITAQLASEQTFHGTKDYLALATNLSYNEEIPVRGRILILDVIDVVPEPGQPLTRHKLKTIYDGEQKGAVTALASCQGNLISAIGQKVYIWTLKNSDLVGVAFVDSELYIHNLLCVKNLVLAADVLKSIQLLRFQSDMRVLSVVSRDGIAREVFTSNFFVDGRRLGFVVSDEHGNVVIYSYDPLDPTSRSGRLLVRRADLRLPSRATCSLRVANRLRHALLSVKSSLQSVATPVANESSDVRASGDIKPGVTATATTTPVTNPNAAVLTQLDPEKTKHSIYLGTQSGAVFLLGPIRDKMYSRLRITEKNLIHHLGPTCGMLPRLCWNYRSTFPELANPCGQVADADLLWRFLVLPHSQRLEIAKKSGQSLEGIMDDIADLNATTVHF